jgi:hypothetical protein
MNNVFPGCKLQPYLSLTVAMSVHLKESQDLCMLQVGYSEIFSEYKKVTDATVSVPLFEEEVRTRFIRVVYRP